MKEKAKLEEEKKDEEKEDPKGIPEFWLTVFKNVDLLSDMVQVRSSPDCFDVALVFDPSVLYKEGEGTVIVLDVFWRVKIEPVLGCHLVTYPTQSREHSEISSYFVLIC